MSGTGDAGRPSSPSARLAALVVGRPRAVLVAAAVLCLAVVPLLLRFRLDTNLVDLLPRGMPAADTFARFTAAFGGEQILVVLVESEDEARLAEAGEQVASMLRKHPSIAEVRYRISSRSAELLRDHMLDLLDDEELTELARRTRPEALSAQARRLRGLLAAPGGSAMAPLLTNDPLELLPLLGKRMQAGLPVDTTSGFYKSADGKALLLFARPTFSPFSIEEDRQLLDDLGASLGRFVPCAHTFDQPARSDAPCTARSSVRVGFTGAYAYALAYRDWLHRDMLVSTVVSVVAVLLFFAVLLGAVRALPVVAPPLLIGLWLTGAMAVLVYGQVNAVSLSFGTILISIGIDLPIQIYNRLREELQHRAPRQAIERTMARLAGPAVLATLGPTVVFLACSLSDYKGLAELGVLAGVGLLLNLASMLTVLPAMLAVVPARLWMPRGGPPSSGAWFAALGRAAAARPRLVLVTVALACTALGPAAARVHIERRLISVEPPSMLPARVKHAMERRFGGRENLLLVLSEDVDRDKALEKGDRWRARAEVLRRRGVLVSYESVASLFPSQAEVARRRARVSALDRAKVATDLRAALEKAGFDVEPFSGFLDRLVNPPPPLQPADAGPELAFLVHAHVKDVGAVDESGTPASGAPADRGKRLVTTFLYPAPGHLDEAIAAVQHEVDAAPGDGSFTGEPLLEEVLYRVVRRGTLRVSVASVLAVVLLMVVYYRRARPALAVLLPLVVAWTLFAAAIGLLDLPLNLFNLLTVPLVVGYGIDDHVFLVHRFEEEPEAGPAGALASTGRAIVVTSLSTAAGFAGLAAARFDGLRLLGVAGTLAVALCLLAAFAVLPALLPVLYQRRDGKIG